MEFTEEYIKQQKEIFLDEFFIRKIRSYHKDDKHINKLSDTHVEPKEEIPRTIIFGLYNQHRLTFKKDWSEYISVVISIVSEAVADYQPKLKKFDWSTLNESESKSNLHLKTHITNRLRQRIVDAARTEQGQTYGQKTVEENGKKVKYRTIIDKRERSSDEVIDDGEKNKTSIINTLDSTSSYGYQNMLYHPNYFLKWFKKNKNSKSFLTNNQKDFLEFMPKFLHEDGSGYTKPYVDDPTQIYNVNQRNGNSREIGRRIRERFKAEHSDIEKVTFLHMKKEADLHLLNELIHIVYGVEYDHVSDLNTNVCNWLYKHLNNDSNTILSDMLHDNLTVTELKHMNKSLHNDYLICNSLIYKIVEMVEGKIEQLHKFDTAVKREKASGTSVEWTKERHNKYKEYYAEFRNTECKVYDIRTGKLKKVIDYKPENKSYIVQHLNTYGVRQEVRELEIGFD